MLWFAVCVSVAASKAASDIWFSSEKMISISPIIRAWVAATVTLPVVACVTLTSGIPEIDPKFWQWVSLHACLTAVAHIMYMRALSLGPISQTQPILALTTIFLVITNPIMTDEKLTLIAWIGVIMVGVGVYSTQHPGYNDQMTLLQGFMAPFVEMVTQPGVRSKLGVAIIFSITANLDRLCVDASSGPFYLTVDVFLISLFLGCTILLLKWKGKFGVYKMKKSDKHGLLVGSVFHTSTLLLHVWALLFVTVPYVIAIKRMSILIASAWGYIVRRDYEFNWYRGFGLLLACIGVLIIVLLGN